MPATGPNVTWYPYNMYREGTPQYEYHCKTYGRPSEFGYKDFIPMFTAEKFDPDEWAELFKRAGAKFAGPVAEHHDGFPMWDASDTEWCAGKMGPKRDVVGELEKAIRGTWHALHGRHASCRELVVLPPLEERVRYRPTRVMPGSMASRTISISSLTRMGQGHNHAEWLAQDKPSKDFLCRWYQPPGRGGRTLRARLHLVRFRAALRARSSTSKTSSPTTTTRKPNGGGKWSPHTNGTIFRPAPPCWISSWAKPPS